MNNQLSITRDLFLLAFFLPRLLRYSKFRSAAETELEWAVADHHQTPPPQQT